MHDFWSISCVGRHFGVVIDLDAPEHNSGNV
jgi:hypothetical protein